MCMPDQGKRLRFLQALILLAHAAARTRTQLSKYRQLYFLLTKTLNQTVKPSAEHVEQPADLYWRLDPANRLRIPKALYTSSDSSI